MTEQPTTGATVHALETHAGGFARWRANLASTTGQRMSAALTSGAATLRSVEAYLDGLGRKDWSFGGIANRVRSARTGAGALLQREKRAVLRRLDRAPVSAVAFVLARSQHLVEGAATRLERGATRVEPSPTGPRLRDAAEDATSRASSG